MILNRSYPSHLSVEFELLAPQAEEDIVEQLRFSWRPVYVNKELAFSVFAHQILNQGHTFYANSAHELESIEHSVQRSCREIADDVHAFMRGKYVAVFRPRSNKSSPGRSNAVVARVKLRKNFVVK